jgi:hypothetical protein
MSDKTLTLRVWTCTTFGGRYPVPTAALVVAPDSEDAARILNRELERIGLKPDVEACNMKPQPLLYGWVDMLSDGEY